MIYNRVSSNGPSIFHRPPAPGTHHSQPRPCALCLRRVVPTRRRNGLASGSTLRDRPVNAVPQPRQNAIAQPTSARRGPYAHRRRMSDRGGQSLRRGPQWSGVRGPGEEHHTDTSRGAYAFFHLYGVARAWPLMHGLWFRTQFSPIMR